MKHLSVFFLLVCMFATSMGWSQTCDHTAILQPDAGQSQLGLIMGDYPRLGPSVLKSKLSLVGGQEGLDWFETNLLRLHTGQEITSTVMQEDMSGSRMGELEYQEGLLALLAGEYATAISKFNASELNAALGRECNLNNYRLVAEYLSKYGDESPLFPHFNGGFFQFCQDSLRWGVEQTDSVAYHRMLGTVSDLVILSQEKPVYFELAGDLLANHSDEVTANWYGALAYLRLAELLPDQKEWVEEKAIFALEAPKTSRNRFDNYQFTQLKKHFANDRSAIQEARKSYLEAEGQNFVKGKEEAVARFGKPQPNLIWLREEDNSNVAIVIRKAFARYAEEMGRELRFAGDVDLKSVKSDTQFNLYAILMVGTVIFAVVFLGYQVRKNRKNM